MQDIDFIYVRNEVNPDEVSLKKSRFIENYRVLFLHAPDSVIQGINEFLEVMTSERPQDNNDMREKKEKIANSMLTLRKQFILRTKLKTKDFKHII